MKNFKFCAVLMIAGLALTACDDGDQQGLADDPGAGDKADDFDDEVKADMEAWGLSQESKLLPDSAKTIVPDPANAEDKLETVTFVTELQGPLEVTESGGVYSLLDSTGLIPEELINAIRREAVINRLAFEIALQEVQQWCEFVGEQRFKLVKERVERAQENLADVEKEAFGCGYEKGGVLDVDTADICAVADWVEDGEDKLTIESTLENTLGWNGEFSTSDGHTVEYADGVFTNTGTQETNWSGSLTANGTFTTTITWNPLAKPGNELGCGPVAFHPKLQDWADSAYDAAQEVYDAQCATLGLPCPEKSEIEANADADAVSDDEESDVSEDGDGEENDGAEGDGQ